MKSKIYALLLLIILFGFLYTLPVDGTPFHKEDSKIDSTKIKDRLNLWPLVYVNQRNFSLLWPLLDVSDNYFAFRPAFSVYNKNNGKKQISVMWPLCTLDYSKSRHHIFPVYWGNNRRVVFPLYWNKWNVDDTEEYNTLIPFWYHHRLNNYSNLTIFPALFSYRKNGDDRAWNWANLAGNSTWQNRSYSYILWPLHISKTDDDTSSSYQHTLPFYILTKNNRAKTLLTIPYSYSQKNDGSGWNVSFLHHYSYSKNHKKLMTLLYGKGETETPKQSWKYITPLYTNTIKQDRETNLLLPIIYWEKGLKRNLYATLLGGISKGVSKQENRTSWLALPVASWGTKTDSSFSANMLGGIIHFSRTPEYRKHHILPAYYWNGEKDIFLSALVMRWKKENSSSNCFTISVVK